MITRNKLLLLGFGIVVFSLASFAKTPTLTGKIVAYDPLLHAAKDASFVANKESVIMAETTPKTKYVKVVFVGFGTTQLDPKYFDGTQPLTVKALRDRTCDENSPNIISQVSIEQRSGSYLLTDAFKNSPAPKIQKLECYEATQKR